MGIAAHAIAHDFSQNLRPSSAGKFEFFENQDSRAFANHKSVAPRIPGTTGFFGRVVTGRERTHSGETTNAHGGDRGLCPARDHDVGIATRDDLVGIADRVRA